MIEIEAPAVAEARGGLLTAEGVTVRPGGPSYIFQDGIQHDAILSGVNRPVPDVGQNKTFDKVQQITGEPFAVYRGVDLSLLVERNGKEKVREAFLRGETVAVEKAIQPLLNTAATDITPTPGTPVTNARQALGLLEQWFGERYTGLPLVHANRLATSLLRDLKIGDGWDIHTKQGTPVANGSGYGPAGPVAAPAGAAWLYISGAVNIWRTEVEVSEANDLKDNRSYALAEAIYVPTIEGPVAAILIGV